MHLLSLHAHPAAPCAALSRFAVRVSCTPNRVLELDYELHGDLAALRIPQPESRPLGGSPVGRRTDGLWRHTCCEIFVRIPGETRYYEWNFAPSGDWACYAFDGYRAALPAIAVPVPPSIDWHYSAQQAQLRARVSLEGLPLESATALEAALSAVVETAAIETTIGTTSPAISYWALTHPPGKPDFHHPENFVLKLL